MTEIEKLKLENEKLRGLILLTDPKVSNEIMKSLSLKQWNEFIRWYFNTFGTPYGE